jgi:predicted RNase H-like HicB family nuclease
VVAIKPRGDVMIHATRRRARYNSDMRNEFTAIVERDGPWFIAYCAEVPGANGQGTTHEDCLANLREAISLILEHRREESLRAVPAVERREGN